jgi:hypothetical protein
MQVFTKPRVIATLMAVGTVAALNRIPPGRKLLGTNEQDSSFIPFL